MCGDYVSGYPHNSPSIAVIIEGRARPIVRQRERLIVKATTINKYIVQPTAAWLAIPNVEIGCRWCIRNLQTLVSRAFAHVYAQHTHVYNVRR